MIENLFCELKKDGVVRSTVDFSRDWLGMEESYFRGLRSRRRKPSAKALASCAVRLKKEGQFLAENPNPTISERGTMMVHLGVRCIEEILSQAEEACDENC